MTAIDRLQGLISSVAIKAPCLCGTTGNITLNGAQTVDGVVLTGNGTERVLVWQQTDPTQNGVYVASNGNWTRDVDFNGAGQIVQGTLVMVVQGTQYGATVLQVTTANPVIGSALAFGVAGAAALALASTFMRASVFPATTAPLTRTALGAAGLTGDETIAGNKTLTGTIDMSGGRAKVPTRTAGDNGTDAASTAFVKTKAESVVGGAVLRSYLAGLGISNDAGSPNTKVDVAAGVCADDSNALILSLSAGTIDCGTTGANGLDAGALANTTWYHAYAIGKTDGTTAFLASTSPSTPTMPSGYTLKRRIGSFQTDGSSHVLPFIQDGDTFQLNAPVAYASSANPGTTAFTVATGVPTGIRVEAILQLNPTNVLNGGPAYVLVTDLSVPDAAPGVAASDVGPVASATATTIMAASIKRVFTNTAAQVRARLSFSDANTTFKMNTLGWVDRRGRDA